MNFIHYIWKRNFQRPDLITETSSHRTASTLELFIDLAFVGVLSTLVHFLVGAKEVNSDVIIGFLLRFMSAFALWWNLMWYNNLFENKTLRHRLFMLLIIITVIGQQVTYNSETVKGYYFLLFFFSCSRFIEVYLWGSAALSKKQPSYALRVSSLYYIFGILSAIILVACTPLITGMVKPNSFIWMLSIILELVLPTVLFTYNMKRLVKKGENPLPPMNHELFKERFGLLFLLVLGEGIVSVIRVFDLFETEGSIQVVILGSMIVFIAYGIWEAYFDIVHGKINHYQETRVNHWATANIFMILGAMLVLGTAPELIHPHYIQNNDTLSKLHLIGISLFNIGLYFAISVRNRNIVGLEKLCNHIERRFAVKISLSVYIGLGILAFILSLTSYVSEINALYFSAITAAVFIVMKQYVRYASEK